MVKDIEKYVKSPGYFKKEDFQENIQAKLRSFEGQLIKKMRLSILVLYNFKIKRYKTLTKSIVTDFRDGMVLKMRITSNGHLWDVCFMQLFVSLQLGMEIKHQRQSWVNYPIISICEQFFLKHLLTKFCIGKIITILFSILGIPIMGLCWYNTGQAMARCVRFLYSKIHMFICGEAVDTPFHAGYNAGYSRACQVSSPR